MRNLLVREEAQADLQDAALWYEAQHPGLGHEFLDAAAAAMINITDRPHAYPMVHRATRRALIKRFPFAIFYRESSDSLIVIAVMHASRHPSRWKKR